MKRIFIFEHIVGGGELQHDLPTSLAEEGAAMLEAVATDFLIAGYEVITMLDPRTSLDLLHADVHKLALNDDVTQQFDRLAAQADATLVIAPEFDDHLLRWVTRLYDQQRATLNCEPRTIQLCADKLMLGQYFAAVGIPTPETHGTLKTLQLPVVIKPRFGAGCQGTRIVRTRRELSVMYLADDVVYQSWVDGTAASVSFLVSADRTQALLPGRQLIEGDPKLSYRGGVLPLEEPLRSRAVKLGRQAVEAVEGLAGYVGVDMILAADARNDCVIEINPRITVSYVGLRQLCEPELAAAMLDPAIKLSWDARRVQFDARGQLQWDVPS